MTDWASVETYRYSVIKIEALRATINPFRPYQRTSKTSIGSGFLIKDGLIITCAHVVADAITITGQHYQVGSFQLQLLSICYERDVAVCTVTNKELLTKYPILTFGDDLALVETTPVVAIGYPLEHKQIKFTTGVVSGFGPILDDDMLDPSLTYIQTTNIVNAGNSGGPLINTRGEVVGIISLVKDNISYAIGTRTIMSIYQGLIAPPTIPHQIIIPRPGFEYNNCSTDLLEFYRSIAVPARNGVYMTPPPNEGIYINKVYTNSVCPDLLRGDLLTYISYGEGDNIVSAEIDRHGTVIVMGNHSRKLTITGLFDIIPIGTRLVMSICRLTINEKIRDIAAVRGICTNITGQYRSSPSSLLSYHYPTIRPYKYIHYAGMLLGQLTLNHIIALPSLRKWGKNDLRYEQRVIVLQIFPNTSIRDTNIFEEGTVIEEINGTKIRTIDGIRTLPVEKHIIIISDHQEKFIISTATAISEDNHARTITELVPPAHHQYRE